jgi:hypothetical protein
VALMVDGRAVETKPIRVVMDPEVRFTEASRQRYNAIVTDLHDMQRRGTPVANTLGALSIEVAQAARALASSSAPADVKTQFETFKRDFDAVAGKFGARAPDTAATAPAGGRGGGGRGGRGGGGAPADASVFGRVGALKNAIMNIWEMPSDALVRQYTDLKAALTPAITEANAVVARARTLSATLARHNVTMRVPAN